MADLTKEQLWEIFQRTARANPKNYANQLRQGEDWENTPVYDMLESSPATNYLRQYLPQDAGSTRAGQWVLNQLPKDAPADSLTGKLREGIKSLPLGGMSAEEKQALSTARGSDPALQRYTVERGRVPVGNGVELPTGDNLRAAAAQAAGVATADLATDGARNIWWFLNAPQALASIAVLQGLSTASPELKAAAPQVPWIKNRNLRMAATVPAWLGVSMAIGNLGRQEGYKAVVPSEVDPTKTADPIAEAASRYILGRTGALLPYDEFVKERPDVSRGEYEEYKAYLHGNSLPLKATLDGIHGPEVNFMGKSIPIATGLLPAVAAVVGARYGVRKAGNRLAAGRDGRGEVIRDKQGAPQNLIKQAESLKDKWQAAKPEDKPAAYQQYAERQDRNESEILKQVLAYSGGAMGATAIAGQTLESIRRALKGRAEVEPEEETTLTTKTTAPEAMRP
jgi:hypothetical protein